MPEVFDPIELESNRLQVQGRGLREGVFDPQELERSRLAGRAAVEKEAAFTRLPPEVGPLAALTEPEAQPGLFVRAMLKGGTFGLSEKLMPGPPLEALVSPDISFPAELMGEMAPITAISGIVRGSLRAAPRAIRWLEPGVVGMLYGGAREVAEGERDPRRVIAHGAKTGAAFQVLTVGLGAVAGLSNYIGSRVLARTGVRLPKEAIEKAVERSVAAPDETVIEALGYNFEALQPSQRELISKHFWEIARSEMEYRGFQNPDAIPQSDWIRVMKMTKGSRGAFREMQEAKAAAPAIGSEPAAAPKVRKARAPKGEKKGAEPVVTKPKTIFQEQSERDIPAGLMTTPEAKETVERIMIQSEVISAGRPPKFLQIEGAHLPGGPIAARTPLKDRAAPQDLWRYKDVKPSLRPPSTAWSAITEKAAAKDLKVSPEGRGWKITDGETITALTLDDVLHYIEVYPGGRGGPGAMGPVPEAIMPGQAPKLVWKQPTQLDLFPIPEEAKYLELQLEGRQFQDIGVLSYAVDPIWVGRAAGMAPEFERIVGTVDKFTDMKGVFMQKMRVWMKSTGVRRTTVERMWRTLASGKPIASDVQALTTAEMRVLDEMRQVYRQFLPFINEERAAMGLARVPEDIPYAPGIIDDSIQTLMKYSEQWGGGKASQALPPEFWKALQYNIPEDKFLSHVLERHGRVPYKQDIYSTFEAYISSVTKAMAAKEVLPFIKQLVKPGSPVPGNVKNYLEFMAKTEILGRPNKWDIYFQSNLQRIHRGIITNLEKVPKIGGKLAWRSAHTKLLKDGAVKDVVFHVPRLGWMIDPRPITRTVRAYKTLSYMSLIGMNFKTMMLNLSQPIIGPALLKGGVRRAWSDWFYGYGRATAEFLRPLARTLRGGTTYAAERATIIQKYENLGVLSMMEELYAPTGLYGAAKQKFVDFTFWNMRTSEFINRVSMYYTKTRNLKLVEKVFNQEAEQISRQFSNLINFRYGPAWRSRAMAENPLANLVGQYQTFTIKHLTLLGSMAKGLRNPDAIPKFYTAMERGRGVEYLEQMPMFERNALLRYTLSASAVASALSLFDIGFFQILGRSMVPGFGPALDLMVDSVKAVNTGDPREIDAAIRDLTNIIPLRRFGQQVGILEGFSPPTTAARPTRGGRSGRGGR